MGIRLLVACLAVACSMVASGAFSAPPASRPPAVRITGTTFSLQYNEWLKGQGVAAPWPEALSAMCKRFPLIRATQQWADQESAPGAYVFAARDCDPERVLAICRRYGRPVVPVIGLTNPRWPEAHLPGFYRDEVGEWLGSGKPFSFHQGPGLRLKAYLAAFLKRYGSDPRIQAFQVEDLPLEPHGEYKLKLPLGFLRDEVAFVRGRTKKPIFVTLDLGLAPKPDRHYSAAKRLRLARDLAGLQGVNRVGCSLWSWRVEGDDKVPSYWTDEQMATAVQIVNLLKEADKDPFIADLQGEPSETDPGKLAYARSSQRDRFALSHYRETAQLAYRLGFRTAWLWGAEFQEASARQGDRGWLQETAGLLRVPR